VRTRRLYNQKANLGPLRQAVGFEITFADDQTQVRRVDVASVDDLAAGLPVWRRCQLQGGCPVVRCPVQ
jgi:hypothetical protein